MRRVSRPVALLLALIMAGCGWKVTPPPRPESPGSPLRVADRVVLQMSEAGVVWGGGQLGELTKNALVATGAFGEVYYPIEPRMSPPLRLAIDARGNVDEEVGWGVVKAIIIGALFFIPVGVIRFDKDFNLDAQVVLSDAGQEVQRFRVAGATHVAHTMFSAAEGYEPAARQAAATHLAEEIAAHLRRSSQGGS